MMAEPTVTTLKIGIALILLAGKITGEPVCYSLRYQGNRNVRMKKVECNDYIHDHVEKFNSEQDVSVGKLLDLIDPSRKLTLLPSSSTTDSDLMYPTLESTLLPSSSTKEPDCSDWSEPDPGYYILNITKMSWFEAYTACNQYGANAHLAFIECEAENEFIIRFIEEQLREVNCTKSRYFCDVWIGLNGKKQYGVWKWYETIVQFFGNQTVQESGGEKENCGRLAKTPLWEWRDTDCNNLYYSICET